ncbi:histidine kinase [Streptomyces orinoci]|uniref:histidine kinase n=1 Tax=Streptomyces orinoci TaxID=67339 RepID=A0ABV3JTB2_STRON|nr:histidine kinase [Streptomyces orinoci]
MPVSIPLRPPRRPHTVDLLVAAAGLTGGLLLYALGLSNAGPLGLPKRLALAALVLMAGAEVLRRGAPLTALAIGTAALALDMATGGLLASWVMYTDLVYAAVLYGPPAACRILPRACELVTVLGTLSAIAVLRRPAAVLIGVTLGVLTAAPAWTGVSVRRHRDAAETARLTAERTALLAELDRRQAVVAERSRMARELHDVIAGHLSAIALHSTAALSIGEPEASREALGVIRENSVQGLAEMKRLIGVLRQPGDEEPATRPTLDGLTGLLAQARAAAGDRRFRFRLHDERGPDPLPAPVELAAYRIVQESLTNVVKHAAPGTVRVVLCADEGALTVRVTSELTADGRAPRVPGAGAGLTGMRERVALLGGSLTAGPANGLWQVAAQLPLDPA